ncbi:FAD-dependent tricarballylate dehydrogenase TcuA [Acrocarpospora macrocephala]|uniref:Tricarballylate dehydrogenase n=1 Tax=Acrocarpospora macrocephala TaxID=150177 RepID=A0A5M3WXH4_9ACTN|nr:FAD-dependent tricarballylate dehydrogenase TcuA [Acrocarpospora macrocephala]GES13086.1 tricarballylate dehydrogenase [Acrocarpospora macrocephala]
MHEEHHHYDVVIVGGGNAGLCAAQAALDLGVSVAVLEKAPREERGGNSALTGHMRFTYDSVDDLAPLIDDPDPAQLAAIHDKLPSRTKDVLWDEVMRTTAGLADPDLLKVHVERAYPTILWLRGKGHSWTPNLAPTAGNTMQMDGRGYRLQERHFTSVEKSGGQVFYDTAMSELLQGRDGEVVGVRALTPEGGVTFHAKAVVLACGGFESNPEMRAKYLGPGWDTVKMRGVPYNTGDGLNAALAIGALPHGSWSSCHASPQDIARPAFTLPSSVPKGGLRTSRYAYPYSIMVNTDGYRFVDEASDVRGRTYAKMGRAVLAQPGGVAYQIFGANARRQGLLEDYDRNNATGVTGDTLDDIAAQLGINAENLRETVAAYNQAIQPGPANPNPFTLDGKRTRGLTPDKSNYSIDIVEGPFEAYGVCCGITFTFGGLKVNPETARVQHTSGREISGLYTAGEMLGGLWHWNYPSGSGMMAGAIFGRIAGTSAARAALAN